MGKLHIVVHCAMIQNYGVGFMSAEHVCFLSLLGILPITHLFFLRISKKLI